MKLVTIANSPSGQPGAILNSGEIVNLNLAAAPGTVEAWIPRSMREILEGGQRGLDIVRGVVERVESMGAPEQQALRARQALLPARQPLLSPIPNPRLLLAAGLAYHQHLKEMAGTPVPAVPTAFMKSVNSIVGPGAAVQVPPQATEFMDYEGELAVVFGKRCHHVTAAEAGACIAGYTAANDISARDWVFDVFAAKEPWPARQTWEVNIMGKQLPGFTPLGPALVTADAFTDLGKRTLETRLNGQSMQKTVFSDLIFSIEETIAYLSRWYAFEAGDVLLTGTPAGVGVGRKPMVFMHAGDTVEVEIEGIGVLRNTVV